MAAIKIKLVYDEESVKYLFESLEIKYSKEKLKTIKEMFDAGDVDTSAVEETFEELINEIIQQEFEE